MSASDGGPAFPNKDKFGNMIPDMSLRDWFAGQALSNLTDEGGDKLLGARYCYEWADAMLEARKEKE